MKKSKVKAEFLLVGNSEGFTPSIATALLDIRPNRQTLKGEIIRMTRAGKKIMEKNNTWIIETDYIESYDSSQQIYDILCKIKGKESELQKLYNEYNIDIILMIVTKIENDIFPSIDLDLELIKYLARINCNIRFDQYYNSDNGICEN